MPIRNEVPFVLTVLSALVLLLGPGPAAAQAATARQVLLEAGAKGADSAAEIAQALQPASPRTVAELRLLLGDSDPAVRRAAAGVLGALGDYPVQSLLRLLNDPDRGVRQVAESVLGNAGSPAVAPVGEFFLAESCLSDAKRAAARILGKIGDPAGIPYLSSVLIRYKAGGFPHETGMQAIKSMASPDAICQLLQLILFHNRDLGKQAYLVLLSLDTGTVVRTIEGLIFDPSKDLDLRFFYTAQLNEIAGTEVAAPVAVKFYAGIADDDALPEDARTRAGNLRTRFSHPNPDAPHYRKPLTTLRVNAMYALKRETEAIGQTAAH